MVPTCYILIYTSSNGTLNRSPQMPRVPFRIPQGMTILISAAQGRLIQVEAFVKGAGADAGHGGLLSNGQEGIEQIGGNLDRLAAGLKGLLKPEQVAGLFIKIDPGLLIERDPR